MNILMMTTIALAWAAPAKPPAEVHITPTVELVPVADAVRKLLPDATQFYLREVKLSKNQVAELDSMVSWVPEGKGVKFYLGREAGRETGSVEWLKVDSRHGPLALAVRFEPDGTLGRVIVTHATEETVTWVKQIVDAGLPDRFAGKTLANLDTALSSLQGDTGRMARYMGEVITRGVARALALRQLAFDS